MRPQRRIPGILKAIKYLKISSKYSFEEQTDEIEKFKTCKKNRHLINTRTTCSCHMCGNPRRHFKAKTLQEVKEDIKYKESIEGEDNG